MHPSGGASSQPPSSQNYEPGDMIGGKYRLVRPLDEGGMGTVWVACNVDLDAHVALKLIRAGLDAQSTAVRLLNEARILARLDHPAIVRVNDFGRTDSGEPFIVMELLAGECLADIAYRRGRYSAVDAVRLLLPIAEALSVAHERGVVHRDLKPDNVFLAQLGHGRVQPKVLDFGIAQTDAGRGTRLTRDGTVLGSPCYMSPEQARGERKLDARTDIWSFCIMLYELLVGDVPFDGENYNATLRAIIETEPEPITEAAAGDAPLQEILARGLEKDREQRWPSMHALGGALAAWLMSQGVEEDLAHASLSSTWFGGTGRESDPFSVPPVALPRSSSAPPSAEGAPTEIVDTYAAGIRRSSPAVVTTGTFPPRLSTGGHGAVALTSGSAGRRPRRFLALVLAALGLGVGGLLVWHAAVGAVATKADSTAVGAARPARVPTTRPRELPAPAPVLSGTETTDAGASPDAGMKPKQHGLVLAPPHVESRRSRSRSRPVWKRRGHAAPARPKSSRVGDLKVPY